MTPEQRHKAADHAEASRRGEFCKEVFTEYSSDPNDWRRILAAVVAHAGGEIVLPKKYLDGERNTVLSFSEDLKTRSLVIRIEEG